MVGTNTEVLYAKGVDLIIPNIKPGENQYKLPLKFNTTDDSKIARAVEVAKKSDVVLLAIGENAYQTGEGRSQTNIGLLGLQNKLLEAVYKVNKNVVVVLMNGQAFRLN